MGKIPKVYTREFKEEAVRLAQTSGQPIAQVARELGISDTSIQVSNICVLNSTREIEASFLEAGDDYDRCGS